MSIHNFRIIPRLSILASAWWRQQDLNTINYWLRKRDSSRITIKQHIILCTLIEGNLRKRKRNALFAKRQEKDLHYCSETRTENCRSDRRKHVAPYFERENLRVNAKSLGGNTLYAVIIQIAEATDENTSRRVLSERVCE